jgi:hypothetical protein
MEFFYWLKKIVFKNRITGRPVGVTNSYNYAELIPFCYADLVMYRRLPKSYEKAIISFIY